MKNIKQEAFKLLKAVNGNMLFRVGKEEIKGSNELDFRELESLKPLSF